MATLQDDIEIIKTAIYGKEMRPAIADALTKSWSEVKTMMDSVDELNKRVDDLPTGGGGGTVDPDKPDEPDDPVYSKGCYVVGNTIPCANGATTPLFAVGDAESF